MKNKVTLTTRDHDAAFEAFAGVAPKVPRHKRITHHAKRTIEKVKPKDGFSQIVHIILVSLLPIVAYIFVRIDFAQIAVALVLLSKWRMFSVKARHWPANIRANAIDMIVGVSAVLFMNRTESMSIQLMWVALYAVWLLFIKPKSAEFWVALQAIIGQTVGLMALYTVYGDAPSLTLVIATTLMCYFAARHFFSSFDESMGRTTSYVWAYFAASLSWLLAHWLIYYGLIAQPVLVLSVVGYGLAGMYYLHHTDRLSKGVQQQFVVVITAILMIVLVFSDWGDKTL